MNKNNLEKKLTYFIPASGKPKTSLRIPESHSLYVCPSACGRRHAIRAIKNGEKKYCSFLYITEADVISGDYENIVANAVEELMDVLTYPPKIILVYVNCIDDFLGTDEKALLGQLYRRFPDINFTLSHINPVAMDEKIHPGMRTHDQIYSFLEHTGKKDNGINLIGNYVSLDQESELFTILYDWGIHHVRQLISCRTFDEYMQLADSRLNIVLMPMGRLAAENMVLKLDIPMFFNPISYDIDTVISNYQSIAELLNVKCPDLSSEVEKTRQEIEKTLEHVGSLPVIVDSSAAMQPFALARALIKYGFMLQAVFAMHIKGDQRKDQIWIQENCPWVQMVGKQSYQAILGFGFDPDCLAIGHDCAYTLKAHHFVDIRHDETFYGFHGIRKLMKLIRDAADSTARW